MFLYTINNCTAILCCSKQFYKYALRLPIDGILFYIFRFKSHRAHVYAFIYRTNIIIICAEQFYLAAGIVLASAEANE